MIQAVLFDLDGTLTNTIDDIATAMNRALRLHGLPGWETKEYCYLVGNGAKILAQRAVRDRQDLADAVQAEYQAYYEKHTQVKTQPYDGIPELLHALAERGLKLAVLSNKPDADTKNVISHFFPDVPFSVVRGQVEGVPVKPDKAGALLVAEQLGIAPADFLYLGEGGRLLLSGLLLLVGVLAVFALVDVPLQRQLLRRRLRMSIEEVKKEMKEVEGNAEVKGKMKLRMREMVGRRMLAAVPRADLVVMNPTHYAVALKYDEATMAAPRVVAKGADLLALRMRDLARDAKVPVLQAPPLARALYAHCEVDREIPARLFGAVAQVLAWVYQVRDALAKGRPAPAMPPMPEVPAEMDTLKPPPGSAE